VASWVRICSSVGGGGGTASVGAEVVVGAAIAGEVWVEGRISKESTRRDDAYGLVKVQNPSSYLRGKVEHLVYYE
jgi:hypothetical protein